ncbi:ATP-grasp fold amidoligase family protein [Aquipuribacter hungaricus]|uniref:ATP-grasp fold amidoligase family protein n=1 Tax=Aquipuribacter hungaricus TaxID=545624 RepID=A0ABV7WCG7_9MICO
MPVHLRPLHASLAGTGGAVRRRLRRRAAAVVPVGVRRRVWYRRRFGRTFRSRAAVTFNDKVTWRILHDRRPLLEGTCDKLQMKEQAARLAGDLVRVPRTLWSGTDVAGLAGVGLPEHWVLKPNHSTQLVHMGHGRPDVDALRRTTAGWVEEDLAARTGEWAYRSARPLLLVEELVGEPGATPPDFKVFVYDGVPRLVLVHSGRSTDHRGRVYTPSWEPRPWAAGLPLGPDVPRPQRLDDMLAAAAALADGFDMLRVDFYEHDGVLWFGELTPYPGSGLVEMDRELDEELGRWWRLPELPA